MSGLTAEELRRQLDMASGACEEIEAELSEQQAALERSRNAAEVVARVRPVTAALATEAAAVMPRFDSSGMQLVGCDNIRCVADSLSCYGISDDAIAVSVTAFDADGDGKLNDEEFATWWANVPAKLAILQAKVRAIENASALKARLGNETFAAARKKENVHAAASVTIGKCGTDFKPKASIHVSALPGSMKELLATVKTVAPECRQPNQVLALVSLVVEPTPDTTTDELDKAIEYVRCVADEYNAVSQTPVNVFVRRVKLDDGRDTLRFDITVHQQTTLSRLGIIHDSFFENTEILQFFHNASLTLEIAEENAADWFKIGSRKSMADLLRSARINISAEAPPNIADVAATNFMMEHGFKRITRRGNTSDHLNFSVMGRLFHGLESSVSFGDPSEAMAKLLEYIAAMPMSVAATDDEKATAADEKDTLTHTLKKLLTPTDTTNFVEMLFGLPSKGYVEKLFGKIKMPPILSIAGPHALGRDAVARFLRTLSNNEDETESETRGFRITVDGKKVFCLKNDSPLTDEDATGIVFVLSAGNLETVAVAIRQLEFMTSAGDPCTKMLVVVADSDVPGAVPDDTIRSKISHVLAENGAEIEVDYAQLPNYERLSDALEKSLKSVLAVYPDAPGGDDEERVGGRREVFQSLYFALQQVMDGIHTATVHTALMTGRARFEGLPLFHGMPSTLEEVANLRMTAKILRQRTKNAAEAIGDADLTLLRNAVDNEKGTGKGNGKKEVRILFLGFDGSGKTTLLYRLKLGDVVTTIPTVGFNVESVDCKNKRFTIWDVGGQDKLRVLWKHYYAKTDAVVYVVDAHDKARLEAAGECLKATMAEEDLSDVPLVVVLNKTDLPSAATQSEVLQKMRLSSIEDDHDVAVIPCCAAQGQGVDKILPTVADMLSGDYCEFVDLDGDEVVLKTRKEMPSDGESSASASSSSGPRRPPRREMPHPRTAAPKPAKAAVKKAPVKKATKKKQLSSSSTASSSESFTTTDSE